MENIPATPTQLDSMKAKVESDVNAGIAQRALQTSTPEAERMAKVAGDLRGNAIDEVVGRDRDAGRVRGLARISQFVNFGFGVVYALLGVRLVLGLLGARSGAGFVQLIDVVTNPFYSMFRGIVASPTIGGGYTLAVPILIAMGAWGLLHLGVLGLMRLIAHRNTEI